MFIPNLSSACSDTENIIIINNNHNNNSATKTTSHKHSAAKYGQL